MFLSARPTQIHTKATTNPPTPLKINRLKKIVNKSKSTKYPDFNSLNAHLYARRITKWKKLM